MGDELGDIDAWAAQQRADDAIGARARAGWLRRQAEEEATWLGTLTDLMGRGEVSLTTLGGRTWRGVLAHVGSSYCALEMSHQRLLVRAEAIAAVHAAFAEHPPTGDEAPVPNELAHVLAAELLREPVVTVWFAAAGEPIRGQLVAVSDEVVTLRRVQGAATVVARLQSISEVLLATSG